MLNRYGFKGSTGDSGLRALDDAELEAVVGGGHHAGDTDGASHSGSSGDCGPGADACSGSDYGGGCDSGADACGGGSDGGCGGDAGGGCGAGGGESGGGGNGSG